MLLSRCWTDSPPHSLMWCGEFLLQGTASQLSAIDFPTGRLDKHEHQSERGGHDYQKAN